MGHKAAKTGQKVQLKGYNGRVDEAEMARVSMCIGSRKWTGDVALVSGRDLDGKGILAINLRDQDSWNIINEFSGKVQGVNVVETRSGKKEREQVELEDSKCVIEENVGSTSIVMDEEVENVECTDEDCSGHSTGGLNSNTIYHACHLHTQSFIFVKACIVPARLFMFLPFLPNHYYEKVK